MNRFLIIPYMNHDFEIVIPVHATTLDKLTDDEQALCREAIKAIDRAYAPYSHFSVGAAISLDNGETITGSNQENVAYPSGTCAERTAAFYAHSRYPDAKFQTIAIAARGTDGLLTPLPTAPCGACRQVLLEYEIMAGHNVKVILVGADTTYVLPSVQSLLPLAFSEF